MSLRLTNVSFAHEGSPALILDRLTVHLPRGWTAVIGANGSGKTTLLRLATGHLQPTSGRVEAPDWVSVYCEQRTDDAPADFEAFCEDWSPEGCVLRGRLKVQESWATRWRSLSHGERKRAQVAVALWRRPDLLAIDEPTNHLDSEARRLLEGALASFDGVGLLVSHDRELLDGFCERCLSLEPGGAVLRPGGYSQARAQERRESESIRRSHERQSRELKRLERERRARRAKAERANAQRSKRGLARGDSDGRARVNLAILTGKDGGAGRRSAQMAERVARARRGLRATRVAKEGPSGVWLQAEPARRRVVLSAPPGRLALGDGRFIKLPGLQLGPEARVALTGPNGAGKSTLLRHLLRSCPLPRSRLVYLPQELSRSQGAAVMAEVARLGPERRGSLFALVSRLGSDASRLQGQTSPSPGELRKVLLALGLLRQPQLLVLDEPTNHLDLPAIEALEEALVPCPCALLLVSHDGRFRARLAWEEWALRPRGEELRLVMGAAAKS